MQVIADIQVTVRARCAPDLAAVCVCEKYRRTPERLGGSNHYSILQNTIHDSLTICLLDTRAILWRYGVAAGLLAAAEAVEDLADKVAGEREGDHLVLHGSDPFFLPRRRGKYVLRLNWPQRTHTEGNGTNI